METNEILYMLAVVAIGSAITFFFRSVPFLLFSGRQRSIPKGIEKFGAFISPVIIACLIVYAYSGLEWKTIYPYLAGLLTIGLQIVKRNPLVSILAGTFLYMILLACGGCATTHELRYDAARPCVAVTKNGMKFLDKHVYPKDVPRLLKKHHVPKDATIHILLEDENANKQGLWVFQHNILAHAGYTRSLLVTKRKAQSGNKNSRGNDKRVNKKNVHHKKADKNDRRKSAH